MARLNRTTFFSLRLGLISAVAAVFSCWHTSPDSAFQSEALPPAIIENPATRNPISPGFAGAPGQETNELSGSNAIPQAPSPNSTLGGQEFRGWVSNYVNQSDVAAKRLMVTEGRKLAAAHRAQLAQLIVRDPKAAIKQAVPNHIRAKLPSEILSELEEPIQARGLFGVYADAHDQPIRRVAEIGGRRFDAHVFGRRVSQVTTSNEVMSGVAVGQLLALADSPQGVDTQKEPEPVEPHQPGNEQSSMPASGLAGNHSKQPGHSPGCAQCAARYGMDTYGYEGATGGPIYPSGPMPATTSLGTKTCMYLRVAFPETSLEPQSEAAACDMMRMVNDWFVSSSYGKLYLLTTVTPLIILPRTEAWYKNVGGEFELRDDAIAVARKLGYNGDLFDHLIFAYKNGPGNFGGFASIGGRFVWLKQIDAGTAAHELGHNFGLNHANSWETSGQSVTGPGTDLDYGNSYDWMGTSRAANGDFNACWKNQIGWLSDDFVHQIRQSGTYRIYPVDQSGLDPARRYGFAVRTGGDRVYWGELRQRFDAANATLANGLLLNWAPWAQSAGTTDLLDTTPGSAGGKNDAALTIGRTLSDTNSGVHITPIGRNAAAPDSMDVVVNIGPFAGNTSPSATVVASKLVCAPGEVIQFTTSASDSDGDALAIFWDFGDGILSANNTPAASRSWASPGRYVVRCTVSDMMGGTASDSVLITVGAPSTFTVSGTVTSGGLPLANVRVHNGQTGANYRGAFTDSDGTYTISGLAAGNATITAVLYGHSITPAFTNPLAVSADVAGANFTALSAVQVSLSVLDASATEGNDTAKIRISRTGPVGSSLGIALARFDGSSYGTDFMSAPEIQFIPAIGDYGYAIPAGASYVDIVFTPANDGETEGIEALTIQIGPTSSYIVSGGGPATVSFLDTGVNLPVVSLEVVDQDAGESGSGASFTIRRLGSAQNPLQVSLSVTGSATNGVDYSPLPTSITIPAGEFSASVPITPLNDTASEGLEDITLAIATHPSYLIAPTTNVATAFVTDDDVPTVSIVATDASASEAGQATATFVVSRTGDLSASLTLAYSLAGSAQHGVDYATLPGTVTIPAGATSGSITIIPIDDQIGEATQTVGIQIRGQSSYVVAGTGYAVANITDNDLPVVTVGITDGAIAEPADAGQLRFTTTGSGSGNITIHYTVSGTATSGVDFTALPGTLTISKNGTVNLSVAVLDDALPEDAETITVTIDPDPSYTTFLDTTATLRLLDNERPIVNVSPASTPADEGAGSALTFYVSRQGPTTAALTVSYSMGGTAVSGSDYQALSGSVSIPAGQTGVSIVSAVVNDAVAEGTETAVITLTPSANYGLGTATASQSIIDNETPSVSVRFGTASAGGSESTGAYNIPVTLSTSSANPVTVDYAISGGSATGGVDFNLPAGTLTFEPGITSLTIPLAIVDDLFDEPAQTVVVELKNARNAALGTKIFTYTISDNDNPPPVTVGFSGAVSSAPEASGQVSLQVSLSGVQAAPVSVQYSGTGGNATGGGVDYTLSPGTLTFAPGETVKSIPIAIVDDTLTESDENILVSLNTPSGAELGSNVTQSHTITNPAGVLVVAPTGFLSISGPASGPFGAADGSFVVSNGGDTPINWSASADVTWLAMAPAGGTLNPGASALVSVSASDPAKALLPATYSGVVTFVNSTNAQGGGTRTVKLNVLLPPTSATQISFTAQGVELRFYGTPGTTYSIKRSDNLDTWSTIGSRTAEVSGVFEFTDTEPLPGRGFYQAVPQ